MKIQDIRVHVLVCPLETPFAFSQGWVNSRSATLVEIITDNGITGWGEAFSQGLEPPQIAAAAIEYALKPVLLERNPLDSEVLWHELYNRTRDYGRSGSVMSAISSVDMALWDIAGQFYQQPVAQLLGGFFRSHVQPYATGFYRLQGQGESDRLAEEALQHFENGFTLMKVKLGFGVNDDIQVMQAIGKALQGSDVRLMVDTNHAYGRHDALSLGEAIEEYDLLWYEEPVAPEDPGGYRELKEKLAMPIAGGENEHSAYGFRDWFSSGALDIAQPDLGSCGGFSAARHIVAMAQAHAVRVNPHVWGSAVAQAASLQLLAALPVTNHNLFAVQPILEFDTSSHPFRTELLEQPMTRDNNLVEISTQPGLGIQVNRSVIEHYRVN